jgi:hypothetical protein
VVDRTWGIDEDDASVCSLLKKLSSNFEGDDATE